LQLVDSTRTHSRLGPNLEAGTSTIADLKDDANASSTPGATSDSNSNGRTMTARILMMMTSAARILMMMTEACDGEMMMMMTCLLDANSARSDLCDSGPGVVPTHLTSSYRHRECIDASWKAAAPTNEKSEAQQMMTMMMLDEANAEDLPSSTKDRLSELAEYRKNPRHCNVPSATAKRPVGYVGGTQRK
jgi:hypothetical protein